MQEKLKKLLLKPLDPAQAEAVNDLVVKAVGDAVRAVESNCKVAQLIAPTSPMGFMARVMVSIHGGVLASFNLDSEMGPAMREAYLEALKEIQQLSE